MTDNNPYTPPAVWTWQAENGGTFANINRPIAGATHDKPLSVGKHPLQLYSLATPNGVTGTVMLVTSPTRKSPGSSPVIVGG